MVRKSDDSNRPLGRMCSAWENLLRKASEDKERKFGRDAATAMRYFRAHAEEIWSEENIYTGKRSTAGFISSNTPTSSIIAPSFRVCLAKVAQCVHLFSPQFVPDNPVRVLTPRLRKPPRQELFGEGEEAARLYEMKLREVQLRNVMTQEFCRVMEDYQNYTARELDLAAHSAKVIGEAIIKGMGVWWHELYRPTESSPWMVGSFYDTVDNLLLDPDEREHIKDCKWVARRCVHHYRQVEEEYGLPENSLRRYCAMESRQQQAWIDGETNARLKRQSGKSNDLLVYFKIWTRMGVGDYLVDVDSSLRGRFPTFPKHCYLVIVPGCPYPLNMPKERFDAAILNYDKQSVVDAFQWPVPFYIDGRWPFTELYFHTQPNCIWPVAHIKFGLGLLNFLNWCMGYLASKIRTTCQTHFVANSSLSKEFKQRLFSGEEMVLLELSESTGIPLDRVVAFLQAPPMNGDIWRIIEWALLEFDKAVGLTEVLYGMSQTQDRSATETRLKNQNATTRVDYMRRQVQAAMRNLARSEAIMARMLLDGKRDIAPILGDDDGAFWDQYIASQDVEHVFREIEYDIEPDDGPRLNRQQKLATLTDLGHQSIPFLGQLAMSNPMDERFIEPWNNHFLALGKLMGVPPENLPLIPPPPPPPPPEQQGPSPAEQQLAMEQQKTQMRLAIEQAKADAHIRKKAADMELASRKAEMDMAMKAQQAQMEVAKKQAEFQYDSARKAEELMALREKAAQQAESRQAKAVFDAISMAQKLRHQEQEQLRKMASLPREGLVQTIGVVQQEDARKALKPSITGELSDLYPMM